MIHIQRRFVRAGRKSKRYERNQLKLESYEEATLEAWEKCSIKNKIVLLVFAVEIGVSERNIRGKVKMFNPHKKIWSHVNLSSIDKEILRIMIKGGS